MLRGIILPLHVHEEAPYGEDRHRRSAYALNKARWPSTSGTKMLVKRAWTYEDVAADPDTFELVPHPSREPFTLPVWVQHALRTILAAQGPAAR